MQIPISYPTAAGRHERLVEEIVKKLRRGKSKHKDAHPVTLAWFYSWSIEVPGFSFQEIIAGKASEEQARQAALTEDDLVGERVKRTRASLYACIGRWYGTEPLDEVPLEIVRLHEAAVRHEREEKAAFDALPQEEKERQAQEALEALRKDPSFVEVRRR